MQDFIETPRYPVAQSDGSGGGVGFKTFVGLGRSALEQRLRNWTAVRGRWNLAAESFDRADVAVLKTYFMACRGRAVGFRIKDLADYTMTDADIGTGNGSNKIFRLQKQYTFGSVTYNRRIWKPVSGTQIVKVAGAPAGTYSLDTTTGIITFVTAPLLGQAVTASCEFDVPVRFDTDTLPLNVEDWEQHSVAEVPVIELRFED